MLETTLWEPLGSLVMSSLDSQRLPSQRAVNKATGAAVMCFFGFFFVFTFGTLLPAGWSSKLTQEHEKQCHVMFCSYCLLQAVSFGGPQKELISLLKVPTVGRVQEEKKITAAEASDQRRRIKGSAMDGNRQCVACFAWELVSAVSKTRARTEKNQMWPLVLKELLRAWTQAIMWHHLPDGSLISTRPLERHRRRLKVPKYEWEIWMST